jgi:cAMP phosphodiesterase
LKVKLLQSIVPAESRRSVTQSLVVDDSIAIDAGCIGYLGALEEQKAIRHVFLSHSHMDHVASLPIFLDNVYEHGPECPAVYASADTIECLKADVFNERLWPDFIRLSGEESPFLKLIELQAEKPVQVGGVRITPVAVDHVVPTFGFLIEDERATIGLVCDTAPTARIWELLGSARNLAGVFLEAGFPNSYAWLAEKSRHLTPDLLRGELEKLGRDVPVYAVHIKLAFFDTIVSELAALELPNLQVAEPGRTYEF